VINKLVPLLLLVFLSGCSSMENYVIVRKETRTNGEGVWFQEVDIRLTVRQEEEPDNFSGGVIVSMVRGLTREEASHISEYLGLVSTYSASSDKSQPSQSPD